MENVILVFIKLKENIDRASFEAFEHRVSQYNINLPSHHSFQVLRTVGTLGNENATVPYDYMEIIGIKSLELMYKTVQNDKIIQAFMEEIKQFAAHTEVLVMDKVLEVEAAGA
ncbi:hypothetical protein ACL9RF_01195 [Sphingobacterium sp. Mn56C]|uniref:hypothetical protein n=1 Tax=Sphingobacterium sp. Mn56C TaxID=3395261 RepID=UPI003BED8666